MEQKEFLMLVLIEQLSQLKENGELTARMVEKALDLARAFDASPMDMELFVPFLHLLEPKESE